MNVYLSYQHTSEQGACPKCTDSPPQQEFRLGQSLKDVTLHWHKPWSGEDPVQLFRYPESQLEDLQHSELHRRRTVQAIDQGDQETAETPLDLQQDLHKKIDQVAETLNCSQERKLCNEDNGVYFDSDYY